MANKDMKPAGLIAVIGAAGAGKSSFINAIVGKNIADTGHSLESQTDNIKEYDFLMENGLHVTLVDTPGFNDYASDGGGESDLVILKEIGEFQKKKYNKGRMFSGILYLHNICEPKIGSSLQRQMAMFKKLCGPDPLKNVVVVTTFWDEVDLDGAIQTETELKTKDKFFKGLVEGKSKFVRFGKFRPGEIPTDPEFLPPATIVSELVAHDPVFLRMQEELAEGKTVEENNDILKILSSKNSSATMVIKEAGLIAVIGATGVGKSSFINTIVGKNVADVGDSLEGQTNNIKEYEFLMENGLHVTLVDTPGFNDYTSDGGGKSDLVILKEIGEFLKKKYDEGRKFSGILYLHDICTPKIGSSLQRQMAMFKKLCGPDPLKNVVVVTTFWDEAESLEGAIQTETELKTKDKFFKGLVEGKSKFVRFGKFRPGEIPKGPEFLPPVTIVSELVALDPVFLEMQKELAEGKTVEETSAVAELYKELQNLKLAVSEMIAQMADLKARNIEHTSLREAVEDESRALESQTTQCQLGLLNDSHSNSISGGNFYNVAGNFYHVTTSSSQRYFPQRS